MQGIEERQRLLEEQHAERKAELARLQEAARCRQHEAEAAHAAVHRARKECSLSVHSK